MRTLLLADDNITVQRVIALTFAGEQIQVVTVADGQQAIEKMAAGQPDIVLAGTTLPNVNGYDLARFMRGKTELQMVPVLLLAGAFDIVDEARLAASGANGIIEKPVEPTTLINRVRELLGLKSEDKPAPTGRLVTPGSVPAERTRPSAMPPRSVTPPRPASAISLQNVQARQDHPRDKSGLDSESRSMADSTKKSGDHLDSLDAAFEPEITNEMLDQIASRVADRLTAGAFGEALKDRMAATMHETVRNVVTETSERLIRDSAPGVVAETSERIVRDTVRTVVAEASERALGDVVPAVVAETSERLVRDTMPAVVAGTSERLARETIPGVIAETSERLVRETVLGVVVEASERLIGERVAAAVTETAERLIREAVPAAVPAAVAEASERVVRENVRDVVLETSERLVREEIERIKSRART